MTVLVGREHACGVVRAEVARTIDSHGGLVLVNGEAGIGKTTLVADAARAAREAGAVVVGGSCWDRSGAPDYWPWIQVLRSLERQVDQHDWRCATEAAGQAIQVLLGELERVPSDPSRDRTAGFELADAVATALTMISHSVPVVVVVEDLHWADAASLQLMEFVVRHAWFERLLIVGTFRDADLNGSGASAPLLHALSAKATTLALTGLEPDAVGALMARVTGRVVGADVAAEVHRRTGGNPFFVEQLAGLWESGAPLEATTPGIRGVVAGRVAVLAPVVRDVLTAAAVLGADFDAPTVAAVAGRPEAEVVEALRQAAVGQLLVATDGGRYAFRHGLVRDTLYDGMDDDARRAGHAAVVGLAGSAAAGTPVGSPGPVVGEAADLAHHAYLAVPYVSADQVVGRLLTAGREASCRMAFGKAARHYRRALEVLPVERGHRREVIERALTGALRRSGDLASAGFDAAVLSTAPDGDVAPSAMPGTTASGDGDGAVGPANEFRLDGDVWAITFAGRTVHLPDAKGLRDLRELLGRPGADIPAADLLRPDGGEHVRRAGRFGGDPVLDDAAKAAYRTHLDRLDEQIDRALAAADDGRAAELDRERAEVLDQLREASGLGGRDRILGSHTERSRKTVSARIRDAMRRIDDRHPELGEHLRASVGTGSRCRYAPAVPTPWRL